ncbi:MAG TPA: transcriptional repressor [Ilumatobacteraceae bacterium]|nr:transcriptional repressor [Ilumatobacteraceae bacterium]
MRAPAELNTAFRAQGLKVTPQRQLLFRLLHGNMTHPTAEALYAVAVEQMPGISLRTVYQTLNDLAAMGELQVVQAAGGSTRFDPNVEPHHHARCDACGSLSDVYVHRLDELQIVGFDGFAPERANIVFSGLCGACQPSPANSTTSPTNSTKEQS